MIELGFKQVERLTKAGNFYSRFPLSWQYIKGAWYCIRYGGTKVTTTSPNYISEENAKRLVLHLVKQLGVIKSESD